MKILLAYQSGLSNRDDPYISVVPTGLCFLHACLQESGYDSLLANFSAWPISKVRKKLLAIKPDLIGISQWTHNRHASLELARICREVLPYCTIVFGGGHASFCYDEILAEWSPVDIVVCGEGESTLMELVSARKPLLDIAGIVFRHNGKIVVTQQRNVIDNLDALPFPSRYLENSIGLDLELQAEFIVTTRGCPAACFFCSSPDFWGRRVRFRSPDKIMEEIRYIRQKYGLIYFSIRDDTFTADRIRVLKLCSLLQEESVKVIWNCQSRVTAIDEELLVEMKRAGCECIQLGIESGSPEMLRKLGKKITPEQIKHACSLIGKVGINLSIYLISDIPGESASDTQETVDLIRFIRPDDGYVSPLAYYPGTQIYKDALKSGLITQATFSKSQKDAIYVSSPSRRSSARLLKELAENQRNDSERFLFQKRLLGYCFVTNIIASEWFYQQGEYSKAEKELLEITVLEPDNPWGWSLLGDLYFEMGNFIKGRKYYSKMLDIVPKNNSAKTALSKT